MKWCHFHSDAYLSFVFALIFPKKQTVCSRCQTGGNVVNSAGWGASSETETPVCNIDPDWKEWTASALRFWLFPSAGPMNSKIEVI